MSFLAELRKRKVFQVTVGYLAVAWLVVEVAATILPAFDLPAWVLRFIVLLFALGFPVALLMAWALELTPEGVKLDTSSVGSHRMLTVALLLAALALVWFFRDRSPAPSQSADVAEHAAPAAATPTPTDRLSLAVLPFADLSQAGDQEYLSDGLAEEIITQLAQIDGMDVRARTSSFAFKGRNEDVRIIGRMLDAGYLLEGSVRQSGDKLRITAQLIRASDGSHLWSKTYNDDMENIFAMQEQVARDVATALSVKLDVSDLSRAAGGTTHVGAYEKFLQARAAMARIDASGGEQSVVLLREAVQLDPNFGAAWVTLAQSLYDLPGSLAHHPEDVERELADILAHNLREAPDAPWTQHLLAYDHLAHYRWAEADAALAKVAETAYGSRRLVDPWTNPPIYLKWARLFVTGRATAAYALTDAWVRTDPLNLYASTVKVMFLPYLGREDELPAEIERSRGLEGEHWLAERHFLLQMLGDPGADPATVRAQFVIAIQGSHPGSLQRRLFERLDDPQAARAELQKAFDDPDHALGMLSLAHFADSFGDGELALAVVRKAAADPAWRTPFQLGYLLWYPYKTAIRSDPRFKELLREIGLVDYWRTTGNWGDYCKPTSADNFECR